MLARFVNMKKHFGATKAVDGITVEVEAGEIRAIVGENGSGKSTLLSMIAGILRPDSGEMELNGSAYHPKSQADANRKGVSMIVQEISTLKGLTVAENIFLGREKMKGGTVQRPSMVKEAQALLDSLNFPINAADEVSKLTTAKKQMILVARTVLLDSKLNVMDQPTTAI